MSSVKFRREVIDADNDVSGALVHVSFGAF